MVRPPTPKLFAALITLSALLHALPPTVARAASEAVPAPDREPPPQRVTLDQMNALAAGAALREPEPLRLTGLGPAGLDWVFLGPRPMTGDYWSGGANVSGRVSCVAVHPTNASIAYAAAAQGGIWKTVDSGVNWTVLTDGLSSIASGWLSIDAAAPNTLWYATGEQHGCGDCFYGDGLFKSTDAGSSWNKLATVSQVGSYVARVLPKPGDATTLYLGSSRGFVRSSDSGASWSVTLAGGWCDDVAVDPINTANVWAAIEGKGVYRSTDSGVNWTITLAAPARVNLAVSKNHPSVLFASLVTGPGYLFGMYKSSDGGQSWALLGATPDYLGGQGWYDNTVVISPTDTNTVIAGGVYPYSASAKGIIKTVNGGATWTDITHGIDNSVVHPDQHCLAFGPDGALWLGNDGGVWKSPDLGAHWLSLNNGLGITQFYSVAAHPTDTGDIIGGTQDNGSARYRGTGVWPQVVSGDGGPVMYQRESPNFFYTTYVRLNPLYKWNDGAYVGAITGAWAGSERADWANGPLIEDPTVNGTFYVGTYRVWKSTNSGGSWNTVSPDLSGGSGRLLSLAVSPLDPNQLWSGSSDGNLRRTRDGGADWTFLVPNVGGAKITDLSLSPADTAIAYVCADMTSGRRIQYTDDGGDSLTDVSGNLPVGVRSMCLAVDWRTTPARLYVGTDYGVYASLDGGGNWVKASNGMPNVAIYELAIDTANSKLVAATHGRGMWRANLDVSGPALAITAPTGGESWPVGASRTITWTASDPSGVASVDLLLSLDGGVSYPNRIASNLANTGSYPWTVAPGATTRARVRVVAKDALGQPSIAASAANFALTTIPTAVSDGVTAYALEPVAPSPGRAPFTVRFALPEAGAVTVEVYDVGGRRVRSLAAGGFGAGRHALIWDGHDRDGMPSPDGVYFVRLRATGQDRVRRVALVR